MSINTIQSPNSAGQAATDVIHKEADLVMGGNNRYSGTEIEGPLDNDGEKVSAIVGGLGVGDAQVEFVSEDHQEDDDLYDPFARLIEDSPQRSDESEPFKKQAVESIADSLSSLEQNEDPNAFLEQLMGYLIDTDLDYEAKHDLAEALHDNIDKFRDILSQASTSDSDVSIWQKAALKEIGDAVLNRRMQELRAKNQSFDPFDDAPEIKVQDDPIATGLDESLGRLTAEIDKEAKYSTTRDILTLIRLYPDLKNEDIKYEDLRHFDRVTQKREDFFEPLIDEEVIEPPPTIEEINVFLNTMNSLDQTTKLFILNEASGNKRLKIYQNSKIIDRFVGSDISDSDEINRILSKLTDVTGLGGYGTSEKLIDSFVSVVELLDSSELSAEEMLDFMFAEENLIAIADIVNDDNNPNRELILKLADTKLFSKYNDSYRYGEYDPRTQVLELISHHPDSAGHYLDKITPLIVKVESSGFPMELIAGKLLQGFHNFVPEWRDDIELDDVHKNEEDTLFVALQLGDSLNYLYEEDPKSFLAIIDSIVDDHSNMHGVSIDERLEFVSDLSTSLDRIKEEDPELAEWVLTSISGHHTIGTRLRGLAAFEANLELAKYALTFPELRDQIVNMQKSYKEQKGTGLISNWIKLNLVQTYYGDYNDESRIVGKEALNQYFGKIEVLRPFLENNMLSLQSIINMSERLTAEDIQLLKDIYNSDVYKQILSHDHITGLENESGYNQEEIDFYVKEYIPQIFVELGGVEDLEKLFNEWEKIENLHWNTFLDFSQCMSEFRSGKEHIKNTDKFKRLESELLGIIIDSSKMTDKDGYPYEPMKSITYLFMDYLSKYDEAEREEVIDWFRKDRLPYAALPVIIASRDNAIESGVEDTPRAIFEWVHSPENRELASRKVTFDYLKSKLGMTPEEIEIAAELALHDSDSFRVIMNIDKDVIAKVVAAGGDLKGIFDEGVFEGQSKMLHVGNRQYLLHRSGVEIAMGLRSLDHESEHPVYGSAIFEGSENTANGAMGYGGVVLVFDPNKLDYSQSVTFTPEDSFHGATLLTLQDAMIVRKAKDLKGLGGERTSDYVEAQIMGGDLSHVMEIRASSAEEVEELLLILPEEYHDLVTVR